MLSSNDYLVAWSVYLLSAAVLLIAGWRLTSWMWGWVRDPLRVITAVLLLTPASVDGDPSHLAPASIIVGFELLTAENGGLGPLLGVRLLLILIFAVLGVWLLRLLWFWLIGSRKAAVASTAHPRAVVARR